MTHTFVCKRTGEPALFVYTVLYLTPAGFPSTFSLPRSGQLVPCVLPSYD